MCACIFKYGFCDLPVNKALLITQITFIYKSFEILSTSKPNISVTWSVIATRNEKEQKCMNIHT